MHIGAYLRRNIVYIPTLKQIPGSYSHETEPVQIVPASDAIAVAEAFKHAIDSGNPPITEKEAAALPSWTITTPTGVTSRRAFDKDAITWSLDMDPTTGEYRMWGYEPFKGGGRVPGSVPAFTLPADTPRLEVAGRAAELICEAAKLQSQP